MIHAAATSTPRANPPAVLPETSKAMARYLIRLVPPTGGLSAWLSECPQAPSYWLIPTRIANAKAEISSSSPDMSNDTPRC